MHEILIIGGGLAGLTAGLFAARQGRSTLVLEPHIPGGHLANVGKIEDFPGFPEGVAGYELGPLVQEQAAGAGAEFRLAEARGLAAAGDSWLVTTTDGDGDGVYRARAVIVAAGSRPRRLGVPGEERLWGKGVSQCASCDAPLHRGKTVAVVGGGDSALQEALTLADSVGRVWLLHRGDAFRAQEVYQQRVAETPTIVPRGGVAVDEVLGGEVVEAVRLRDLATGQDERVEVSGLFVYAGLEPNTVFLRDLLRLDPAGRIPTDLWMRTERPGLLAAGDIRSDSASQAITAAGDGATAALAAHRYLTDGSWPGC